MNTIPPLHRDYALPLGRLKKPKEIPLKTNVEIKVKLEPKSKRLLQKSIRVSQQSHFLLFPM